MNRRSHIRGFTIVELLIVIVIIAILAAITTVSYNGIQQRAKNTAIIDAATKAARAITAYVVANNAYPSASSTCITTTSGCLWGGSAYTTSATFDTNMATISTLPRSIPAASSTESGLIYSYNPSRTMSGVVQPVIIVYYLIGTSQQCGAAVTSSGGSTMVSSTTGYTSANDGSGSTACVISISGPSA